MCLEDDIRIGNSANLWRRIPFRKTFIVPDPKSLGGLRPSSLAFSKSSIGKRTMSVYWAEKAKENNREHGDYLTEKDALLVSLNAEFVRNEGLGICWSEDETDAEHADVFNGTANKNFSRTTRNALAEHATWLIGPIVEP